MELLWPIGFVVALLVAVFVSVADRNLVGVGVSASAIRVIPRGPNKLWTFNSGLVIPLSSVESASVVSGTRDLPKGWRWPGTAIPELIFAGTYVRRGERSFYAIRDGRDVLLLELKNYRYARVVVQTKDPNSVVEQIKAALAPSDA